MMTGKMFILNAWTLRGYQPKYCIRLLGIMTSQKVNQSTVQPKVGHQHEYINGFYPIICHCKILKLIVYLFNEKEFIGKNSKKNIFDALSIVNVCATLLKWFLKYFRRYGKYNKNLNEYHLFIININCPNSEIVKFPNLVLTNNL